MRRKRDQHNATRAKPAKPPEPSTTLGTLGDKLGARLKPAAPPTPAQPVPKIPPPAPKAEPLRLTPEELMQRAFDAASGATVFDAKFLGVGYNARDVELIEEKEDVSLLLDLPKGDVTQDDLLFAETMGRHVAKMPERDRYADVRDRSWVGARWADEVELTELSAEQLHQPDLTGEQRELLKRSRKSRDGIPTLNIRLERLGAAMAEVEFFVKDHGARGARFVRIITGKGRQSTGEPVLKPAVIAWCTGDGATLVRRWAPETDRSGNFGCVVLELDPSGVLRAR